MANPHTSTGRISKWSEMSGKTIRTVVEYPAGVEGESADAVIVFDDNTWATLLAMGSDDCRLHLGSSVGAEGRLTVADYLHPSEMLAAGLVTNEQHQSALVKLAENEQAKIEKRRRELLAELAALR